MQHCVETAVLLAKIGASSTVVAARILHDIVDDSFLTFGHITKCFGHVVSNLVEGVRQFFVLHLAFITDMKFQP